MEKLKDKILQYIISGKYTEDKVMDAEILNDPAFDEEEFDLFKDIWELSDNLKDHKTASKSDAWQNILQETGLQEAKAISLARRWRIAASVLILVGAGLYFVLTSDPYITHVATTAEEVILPDNSKVNLTAESSIRYLKPNKFVRAEGREVYLTGEATFNVEHDPARPFVVITEHTSVDVTGTIFRYEESGINSETENVDGQIKFGVNDGSQDPVTLNKGDKASYDGGPIEVIRYDEPAPPPPPPPPSNNVTVSELVEILGELYPEKLVLSPSLRPNQAVIKVNFKLSLSDLLQSLHDNPLVDISFAPLSNDNFALNSMVGQSSGLTADYSYDQYIRGVPFRE